MIFHVLCFLFRDFRLSIREVIRVFPAGNFSSTSLATFRLYERSVLCVPYTVLLGGLHSLMLPPLLRGSGWHYKSSSFSHASIHSEFSFRTWLAYLALENSQSPKRTSWILELTCSSKHELDFLAICKLEKMTISLNWLVFFAPMTFLRK
jgi:hypothetical protein